MSVAIYITVLVLAVVAGAWWSIFAARSEGDHPPPERGLSDVLRWDDDEETRHAELKRMHRGVWGGDE